MNSFNTTRIDVTVIDYINKFDDEGTDVNNKTKYRIPKWQRKDQWIEEYKQELIVSILKGIDIPKIYVGKIKATNNKYIIDGGHRSRAIKEFYGNKFCININGSKVYYNNYIEHDVRNVRILYSNERDLFNEFMLSIVEYKDIEESDCRYIFNRLQNSVAMENKDIVNSHESELVDFLRETAKKEIMGFTMNHHFNSRSSLPNPEKNNIIYQLLSWFTICFPRYYNTDDPEEPEMLSMKYLKMGTKRDTPSIIYVKHFFEPITEDMKETFYTMLEFIITYISSKKGKIPATDLNSIIVSNIYNTSFDEDKFNDFTQNVVRYKKLKTEAETLNKKNDYSESEKKNIEADELNAEYDNDLNTWAKSRKSGGNDYSAMKIRDDLIKKWCKQ